MTTTATAVEEYDRVRQELAALGDDAARLVGVLSDIVITLETNAARRAVRWQGGVIMAAIKGDLEAWPGCVADWDNMPDAPADWR
jgi:hypothetical protein